MVIFATFLLCYSPSHETILWAFLQPFIDLIPVPNTLAANNDLLWQSALGELELSISKASFTTWFKNTFIVEVDAETAVVGVPNAFTKAWLENKYHPAITKALGGASDANIKKVHYQIVSQSKRPTATEAVPAEAPARVDSVTGRSATSASTATGFNPNYTFETFVVGKGNELAKAAAQAVTEKIGGNYNPLFIYGGVGLGKTHLMQAVANAIVLNDPAKRVRYVTCEKFTNEFIETIREGRSKDFKNIYRHVDVLLIDDIQFLVGKESTQEEFFHTFNALHDEHKQIVISSDRPPKALPTLEQRLISRFEWGMIVDISAPDLETRIAILKTKCRQKNISLSDEILQYVASVVQSNIRELEGALNRIQAVHELNNTTPDLESTKTILSSLSHNPKRGAVTPKQLMATVAEYFDVSLDDITGVSRKRELVVPRQIVMYLMREEIRSSFPSIGHELGGRDHTTAMHAHNKISAEVKANQRIEHDIHLIRQRLYNQ